MKQKIILSGLSFVVFLQVMLPKPEDTELRLKPQTFGGINTEAPLWLLLPKAFLSIFFADLLVLFIFWVQFGEISPVAFGFVIFLSALQILIIVGLRFQRRTDFHANGPMRNDWIDKIGGFWLAACVFGAFFGWICGRLAQSFPDLALIFNFAEIVFTFVLPLLTMLPNLRYLGGKALTIQIPILFFVTLLPLMVGLKSLLSLWQYFGH